jgi:ELP3 family radical SAM enzyme/protein acetyltransferase
MSIEDIGLSTKTKVSVEKVFSKHLKPTEVSMKPFVADFIKMIQEKKPSKKEEVERICSKLKAQHRIGCSKGDIREIYEKYYSDIPLPIVVKSWMIKKAMRANSGVLVVTLVLSPHKFSCKYKCAYCPQETDLNGVPTQPRSYLSSEPAMLRAIGTRTAEADAAGSYDFDIKNQFQNRIQAYEHMGTVKGGTEGKGSHKMEIILSGGTWESYPLEYREQVIREVYWAANTLSEDRPSKSLEEEQTENETAKFRIIGLTLETRPDNITPLTICQYVRWGATRIQIGVQHFDDTVLKGVNRKCYTRDTIRAIWLLKQSGFKVVVHLMPDLPGSSPSLDKWMFDQALTNPDLQFDDVKIYPTAICKSSDENRLVKSKIADWYAAGKYVPYAEKKIEDLYDVLRHYKRQVQPWIRIQRLVRDIPSKSIESGYNKMSNLRQILKDKMKAVDEICRCTFCMEIGDNQFDEGLERRLAVRHYKASGGDEYYFSVEAHRPCSAQVWWFYGDRFLNWLTWLFTGVWEPWAYAGDLSSYVGLYGFLRMRLEDAPGGEHLPQINGCALIREVHVYGFSLGVCSSSTSESHGTQHRGYGQLLMKAAEDTAALHGFKRTAVIAGVGTREYYKNKCGYTLDRGYMVKSVSYNYYWILRSLLLISVGVVMNYINTN